MVRRESKIENILTVGRQRFIGERRAKVHNAYIHLHILIYEGVLYYYYTRVYTGGRSSFIMTQNLDDPVCTYHNIYMTYYHYYVCDIPSLRGPG